MSELVFRVYEPGKETHDVPLRESMVLGLNERQEGVFTAGEARTQRAVVHSRNGQWYLHDEDAGERTPFEDSPLVTGDRDQGILPGLRFRLGLALVEVVALDDAPQTVFFDSPLHLGTAPGQPPDPPPSSPPPTAPPAPPVSAPPATSDPSPDPAQPEATMVGGTEFLSDDEIPVQAPDGPGRSSSASASGGAALPPHREGIRESVRGAQRQASTGAPEGDVGRATGRGNPRERVTGATAAMPGVAVPWEDDPAAEGDAGSGQPERLWQRPRMIIANEAIRDIVFIDHADFVVGRKSVGDRRVDYIIAHDGVSSVHATIRYDGQRFSIMDLGSKNHTYLRGKQIPPEVEQPLSSESSLRFGVIDALFVTDPSEEVSERVDRYYEEAIRLLLKKGSITQAQESRARREAGGDVRRIGEKLLLGGILSVDQWADNFQRAEARVDRNRIRPEGSRRGSLMPVFVLAGLIGIALLAIIVLVVINLLSD